MYDNTEYVTFEQIHDETDNDGNMIFAIDGYPANENEEGSVIASVVLSKNNDIAVIWHHNGYRMNESVLELIKILREERIPEIITERNKKNCENKYLFVKKLHEFISTMTREYDDISRMDYIFTNPPDFREYLYITYRSGAQKCIDITADSCSAILSDFIRKIDTTDFLMPDDKMHFDKI